MRKCLFILIACLSCACQKQVVSSYTDAQIYEMILSEIIQTDSSIIKSFKHVEFHDISIRDKDSDSTEIEEVNKARRSYRMNHGNLLAIRIGSTQEIDGRILDSDFLTFEKSRIASLAQDEKAAYLNLIESINSEIKLDIPSKTIRNDLSFYGRNIKFYRTDQENSVSCHEFSVSQIGFSPNRKYGCLYVGSHRPMAGYGELIFIEKVDNKWKIGKSLGIWVS